MSQFNFTKCEQDAKSLVTSLVNPVPELSSRELYIFSYFFDTALAVNLIGKL